MSGIQVVASIGKAQFKVIGLNPQAISTESEVRFPGAPTWTGMDYQETGRGEERTQFAARTAPHVFKGLDALEWLRQHHRNREPVNYIRFGANFAARRVGLVVIRNLFVAESKLHPFDGVGRLVDVELDLLHIGDPV